MKVELDIESLASTWVERWLKYGGGLIADSEKATISISMRTDSEWRWKHGWKSQRHWHDGWYVGRWRELQDLLDWIPGHQQAIVDHVLIHGEPYEPGKRSMVKIAEHRDWPEEAA